MLGLGHVLDHAKTRLSHDKLLSIMSPLSVSHLSEFRIRPEEKISKRLAHPIGKPTAALVLLAIVQQVATLAESLQIARPVVAWIMIEVGGSQEHFGRPGQFVFWSRGLCGQAREGPSSPIPPSLGVLVPPATVPEVEDQAAMRTSALFAATLCPNEPYGSRDLRPVDRVKPSELAADWHHVFSSTRERSPGAWR